jgi:hypothetical protein
VRRGALGLAVWHFEGAINMTRKQLMAAKHASAFVAVARGSARPMPSTNYVVRNVKRGPCRDIAASLPLSCDAYKGSGKVGSLNMFAQRWNGEVMA